jgi:hypothetical protein
MKQPVFIHIRALMKTGKAKPNESECRKVLNVEAYWIGGAALQLHFSLPQYQECQGKGSKKHSWETLT